MTKIGKYDLILEDLELGKIEYIFRNFDLNKIDEFCSAYETKINCIIALSKEKNKSLSGHFKIVDYKGFYYQALFGNEILKRASLNTYIGYDSYGKKRLKIEKQDYIKSVIYKFIDILGTDEGIKFSETNMGKYCLPKSLLLKFKHLSELVEKNKKGLDDNDQLIEMNELENDINKDGYIYKNFRGIVIFLENFSKRNKYQNSYINYSKKDVKDNSVKGTPEYTVKENLSEAQKYNIFCEEEIGKEEFLSDDEYNTMMSISEDDSLESAVKKKIK